MQMKTLYISFVMQRKLDMETLEDKIYGRIKRYGRGWVMTNRDFRDFAKSASIDWALHKLKSRNLIRPVLRGIYYYPEYSDLLQEELAPSLSDVAQALARKNQWHIQISGSAALYFLGLTTQIPVKTIYFSDGPTHQFSVSSGILYFKHVTLKESKIASPKSEIVVQAIRELGEDHVSDEILQKIRNQLTDTERRKLYSETQFICTWIREKINLICSSEGE